MGVAKGITAQEFPTQGKFLGMAVRVCFNYDTTQQVGGIIVRDDAGAPGVLIIHLDDGRYVLSTECQYSFPRPSTEKPE